MARVVFYFSTTGNPRAEIVLSCCFSQSLPTLFSTESPPLLSAAETQSPLGRLCNPTADPESARLHCHCHCLPSPHHHRYRSRSLSLPFSTTVSSHIRHRLHSFRLAPCCLCFRSCFGSRLIVQHCAALLSNASSRHSLPIATKPADRLLRTTP